MQAFACFTSFNNNIAVSYTQEHTEYLDSIVRACKQFNQAKSNWNHSIWFLICFLKSYWWNRNRFGGTSSPSSISSASLELCTSSSGLVIVTSFSASSILESRKKLRTLEISHSPTSHGSSSIFLLGSQIYLRTSFELLFYRPFSSQTICH